jgi:Flp pilus assembly pilin Flp
MKRLVKRFWRDQRGEASGLAVILLYTILALGATVGLVTLRDQIVQEFGDLAVALDSLDQSWHIPGIHPMGYTDTPLFRPTDPDPEGKPPAGLEFKPPVGESAF